MSARSAGAQLERTMGLPHAVSLIVGTSIGSGIFISPKGVLLYSGSVGMSLIVWVLCGALALMGGLCYAELGTTIRKSGGDWAYIKAGLGDAPAFLMQWMSVFINASSLATLTFAFADYLLAPFFDGCGPTLVLRKMLAIAAIWSIVAINVYSARLAHRMMAVTTVVKLGALFLIVLGGIYALATRGAGYLSSPFEGTSSNGLRIVTAFYSGLWAYDGWANLNFVTEELKNPKRNMPLSIFLSVVLTMVIYLMVNVSYLCVLSKAEILGSNAVAIDWGYRIIGSSSIAFSFAVACSTYGSANGSTYSTGRILFASAREGHMVKLMSMIGVHQVTPMCAILFRGFMATVLVIPNNIEQLIDFFSFTSWLFYGMSFLSLIVLRFRRPNLERPFRVPLPLPVGMLLASCYLTLAPVINNPSLPFLFAAIFLLSGLIFYFPFVHFKLKIKAFDSVTLFFQLLLRMVPSDFTDE